jgi:hypothetical protein
VARVSVVPCDHGVHTVHQRLPGTQSYRRMPAQRMTPLSQDKSSSKRWFVDPTRGLAVDSRTAESGQCDERAAQLTFGYWGACAQRSCGSKTSSYQKSIKQLACSKPWAKQFQQSWKTKQSARLSPTPQLSDFSTRTTRWYSVRLSRHRHLTAPWCVLCGAPAPPAYLMSLTENWSQLLQSSDAL